MRRRNKQILISFSVAVVLEVALLFAARQPSDGPNLLTLCLVPFIVLTSAFSGIIGEIAFYFSIFLFLFVVVQLMQAMWTPPNPPHIFGPNSLMFELFVGDTKVGLLYEPKYEDMFWCSYRIEPVTVEAGKTLRDISIWEKVNFVVKAKDGRILKTFTGGDYVAFCRGETSRLTFRSLWPIDS